MIMQEAINKYVHDGDCIALGGFVTNRKPYAAACEIIRQGKKDLYVQSGAAGGDVDMMIGAGLVKVLFVSYLANSGFTQVGRRFRNAVEQGKILFEDYSLDVHCVLFHAAALGLPFIAVKNMLGSSLIDKWGIPAEVYKSDPKLPPFKLKVDTNPFNPDEQVCYLPVPKIDTAIIHVQKAAPDGTCRIDGSLYGDMDISMAATNCIVTCEELVSPQMLRAEPWRNQLPNIAVDAVVHAPYGAHPSQCANCYDYDGVYLRKYDKASKDDQLFKEFIDEWIYGVEDHNEYVDKLGVAYLNGLHVTPGFGFKPGLKRS